MQEIKEQLKRLGEHLQKDQGDHQTLLRQKLQATQSDARVAFTKRFSWAPMFGLGIAGICVLVVAADFSERRVEIPEYAYENSVTQFSMIADVSDATGLASDSGGLFDFGEEDIVIYDDESYQQPIRSKNNDGEIVDYENEYGAMLEQSVSIRMLTREDDASETVAALFASLGGHLTSIRDNEEFATITGSVPASRMSFFYDELDGLVKNEAFIEKNLRGDSVTEEALFLAEGLDALRTAEADVTAQLQVATTDEEKQRLQESLETISEEIASMMADQEALEDRVDFVTVSVSIEELPSIWEVENKYELHDVIAGFDDASLWQRVVINVLTVFLIVVELVSATFWILIPVLYFVIRRARRRRLLRELA